MKVPAALAARIPAIALLLAASLIAGCSVNPRPSDPPGNGGHVPVTIHAQGPALADVQAALQAAQPGDTVVVPAGTALWESALYVSAGVTLRGNGIGNTVIMDGQSQARSALIVVTPEGGMPFRITGFTFAGANGGPSDQSEMIVVLGDTKGFRIDHNEFENGGAYSIRIHGAAYGLIDHNLFENPATVAIAVFDAGAGDESWGLPTNFGGLDAVYVESNSFDFVTKGYNALISVDGARFVFRNDSVSSTAALNARPIIVYGNYPYEYDFYRGTRSFEIYDNRFQSGNSNEGIYIQGGSGVIFDNTFTGTFGDPILLTDIRGTTTVPGKAPPPSCGSLDVDTCTYPAPDQIEDTYIWNNDYGNSFAEPVIPGGVVSTLIQLNRDVFLEPMPGYTPLAFPYPIGANQ